MSTTDTITKIPAAVRRLQLRKQRRALARETRRLATEAVVERTDPLLTDAFFASIIDASPREARRIASIVANNMAVRRKTVTIQFSAGRTARFIPHTCVLGAYVSR
jgi:hypothetical protein